jgi:hypothetical protein
MGIIRIAGAFLLAVFIFAGLLPAAKPTDYSTDMAMLTGGQVMQTLKLNVSGQKSRVEGLTAGPLGPIVSGGNTPRKPCRFHRVPASRTSVHSISAH